MTIIKPDAFEAGKAGLIIALLEKWLCPLCTKLGWRSDLALQDLIEEVRHPRLTTTSSSTNV